MRFVRKILMSITANMDEVHPFSLNMPHFIHRHSMGCFYRKSSIGKVNKRSCLVSVCQVTSPKCFGSQGYFVVCFSAGLFSFLILSSTLWSGFGLRQAYLVSLRNNYRFRFQLNSYKLSIHCDFSLS